MSNELSRHLSKLGRKGGKAAARALTKEQRIARAKNARAAQLKAARSEKGGAE